MAPRAAARVLQGWVLACLLLWAAAAGAQTDQPIYGDSLVNGWQNWSWATVSLTNAAPVHGGSRSISVTASAWQALYLHHDAFSTVGYTDLVFWIHGGSTGGQLLLVQALLGGTAQTAVQLPALTAGVWQKVSIPLASLGVANKSNMDGFWIQDRSGLTKPTFYVDDASLVAVPPPAVVGLTVDATRVIRTIDARHFGVNTGMWDAVFDTPATISLLTEMGNRTLRYPGGSLSNDYHWRTNTTGNNLWQWETSFDEFAHVAVATGAVVFISANYGSGTPTEAADWVRYANVTKGYGFKYWEIGNENYGSWETDVNTRPHDPVTYATRFRDYYTQMKAVDPTIKIGAVAVTGEDNYANYADHPVTNPRTGQTHNGWTPVMLATLKSLGVTPDFLIHHRYPQGPGGESDAGLLASSVGWAAEAADLRQQLVDYLGAGLAAGVELVATENNSVYASPGKQTTSLVNGLFLADSLATVMTTEFNGLIWWDLRNDPETGNNNSSALYGWRPYGDYGIVNSANPPGPADRYPTFYVAKLLQHFARAGDRLVQAASDFGLLSVYAARRADGSLTLLVVNKSPSTALNASIALGGFSPAGAFTVYSYGIPQDEAARTGVGSADIASTGASGAGPTFAYTFAAYSVTVLSLTAGTPPPAFTYTLGNTGGVSVARGTSGTTGITATLTAGSTQSVSFSASGLPSGATAGFSAAACSPTCSSTLTIATSASTPLGTFTVVVTGSPLGRTTSLTLTVTAPAGGPTLSVSPAAVTAGGGVTATWSGIASPTTTDWIGLYAAGAPDTSYLAWSYVSCSKTPGAAAAAGSCAFPIPGTLAAGGYELRLLANNGYTRLATSNALTVTVGPSLAVSPAAVTAGGSVTATWSGITSPTTTDWIGLYAAGAADTAYLAWSYVSCTKTPGAASAAGSCAFPIPATIGAGAYELRLLANNGYTRLATSNALTVTVGPSLGTSPTSVTAGGSVTATWSGITSPTTTDWIGLYAAGAADTAYLAWSYVSCSKTPGAASAAGSCAFVIPATIGPGTYELRLLANNGYTRLAVGPPLTVH